MEKYLTIKGNWNLGISLDLHTISSLPIFDDYGEIIDWDTERTIIGEELYKIKYGKGSKSEKLKIVELLASKVETSITDIKKLIKDKKDFDLVIDYIIPVPSSKDREFQPVEELAKVISQKTDIAINSSVLHKTKHTEELKSIDDEQARTEILRKAFDIADNVLSNKNIILFDDLYRSGSTLEAITSILKSKGKAKNVIVITLTKTRTKR